MLFPVRRKLSIRVVQNRKQALQAVDVLKRSKVIGVDCEGVALGRFGQLTLMQIFPMDASSSASSSPNQANEELYLVDCLSDKRTVTVFRDLFQSKDVLKVMHDSREDGAALLNQFNMPLKNVFDTQIAHRFLEPSNSHISFDDAIGYFGEKPEQNNEEKPPASAEKAHEKQEEQPALAELLAAEEIPSGGEAVSGKAWSEAVAPSESSKHSRSSSSEAPAEEPSADSPGLPDETQNPNEPLPMHKLIPNVKRMMSEDDELWRNRPLSLDLIRYAAYGSHRLKFLYEKQMEVLVEKKKEGTVIDEITTASGHFAESYASMNLEIEKAGDAAKIGTPLWGMCCAITSSAIYFKLNLGRLGIVSTPSAIQRFLGKNSKDGGFKENRNTEGEGLQVGDSVYCMVSGVSIDGKFLYLDRYDHDWNFHEFRQRPINAETTNPEQLQKEVMEFGREVRHQTGIFSDPGACDVLLDEDRTLPMSGKPGSMGNLVSNYGSMETPRFNIRRRRSAAI